MRTTHRNRHSTRRQAVASVIRDWLAGLQTVGAGPAVTRPYPGGRLR
jgi:hypothetical protein